MRDDTGRGRGSVKEDEVERAAERDREAERV